MIADIANFHCALPAKLVLHSKALQVSTKAVRKLVGTSCPGLVRGSPPAGISELFNACTFAGVNPLPGKHVTVCPSQLKGA